MAAPRISILTAVYDPPRDVFEETVRSVLGQTLQDWQWVLADDCSPSSWVLPRLRELAAAEARITVVARERNGGIVAASSSALAAATGEFVSLLDHDDVLVPTALEDSLAAVDEAGDGEVVDFVYSDQSRIAADGTPISAYLKPDWSPERLRHHMYTSHFAVLRRSLVEEVGGFRAGFDGSQDHDLVLRISERVRGVRHVRKALYQWRAVEGSVALDVNAKPYAWDAGVRAIQDHLDRVGITATVTRGRTPGCYHVERAPDLTTSVSVIIPTIGTSGVVWGQRRTFVVEAIRSVAERSAHPDVEYVVVYDTATPQEVVDALTALRVENGLRVRLVEFTEAFNFSAKCNVGAIHATGDVLVFLNDDMEAKSQGLLETLIAPLAEEGVGATGAKLYFENLRIQHGGVQFGSGTIYPMYYGHEPKARGVLGELEINREVSALTGACIAVRRSTFESVGGFSEALPLNYNDVDFSLKVRHANLRLLWLHGVELYHFESVSRETEVRGWEADLIRQRWGDHRRVEERYSNKTESLIAPVDAWLAEPTRPGRADGVAEAPV